MNKAKVFLNLILLVGVSSIAVAIDPVVEYATYLGGSGLDEVWGMDDGPDGTVVVCGVTDSLDFPTTELAYMPEYPGDSGGGLAGSIFVTMIGADGQSLVYSTYFGGSGNDWASDCKVDDKGRAYIVGFTNSEDFPVTTSSLCSVSEDDDSVVIVLDDSGELMHSTCIGGSEDDFFRNLAIEPHPNSNEEDLWLVYAEGGSDGDHPMVNAYDPSFNGTTDGIIVVWDPNEEEILYSTYIGGSEWDIFHGIDVRDGIVSAVGRLQSNPCPPQESHWHVTTDILDDGIDRGVLWLGELDDPSWVTPPGYGDNWRQEAKKEFSLPGGLVTWSGVWQYYVEPDWDWVYVEVSTDGENWETLDELTWATVDIIWPPEPEPDPDPLGYVPKFVPFEYDLTEYAEQTVFLRLLFVSDGGWSDEDGMFDSSGALSIDESTVTGHPSDTFETEGDFEGWETRGFPRVTAPFTADHIHGPAGGPEDALLVKMDTKLSGQESMIASAIIGGSSFDNGLGVKRGENGDDYATGITHSPDAPATPGAAVDTFAAAIRQTWVAKLSPDLSVLKWYTFSGGSYVESPLGIDINEYDEPTVTGSTRSIDLPTTSNAPYPEPLSAGDDERLWSSDYFAFTVCEDGSNFLFSSYFGGSDGDFWGPVAVGDSGDLYLGGPTWSLDFRDTDNGYDSTHNGFEDGFVIHLSMDEDGDGVIDHHDQCPSSDLTPTVAIEGCDSGVTNHLFDDGCTISDLIHGCATVAQVHGDFVSCVTHLTNTLKMDKIVTGAEKGSIQSCAAAADNP